MRIAITGTMASGKSVVSDMIRQSYPVFDSDSVAKEVYNEGNPCLDNIKSLFPSCFKDGLFDKKEMANIVFHDKEELDKLQNIIYPYLKEQLMLFFDTHELAFAEVPVLFENGFDKDFDKIIVVTCQKETAIRRCMEDRHYTYEEAISRLENQLDPSYQIERASYVIYNDGTLKELEIKVKDVIERIEEEYGIKS